MRLLNTVYFPNWNSHAYPSMLSNADVFRYSTQQLGRGTKSLGKRLWTVVRWPFAWVD